MNGASVLIVPIMQKSVVQYCRSQLINLGLKPIDWFLFVENIVLIQRREYIISAVSFWALWWFIELVTHL